MNKDIKYLLIVGLGGLITSFSATLTFFLAPNYIKTNHNQPQIPTQVSHFENHIEVKEHTATDPATISQDIKKDDQEAELKIKENINQKPSPKPSESPSPSPIVKVSSLQQSIANYFGSSATSITINYQTDSHAQGHYGQKWWLAVNASNDWEVIASGTSYISCSDISGYNFPTNMAPACWDYATNQLVNR